MQRSATQEPGGDRKRRSSREDNVAALVAGQYYEEEGGKRRRLKNEASDEVGNGEPVNAIERNEMIERNAPLPFMFVTRGDHFVPMIPIDQLDASVTVLGLRYRYSLQEVSQAGGQICIGHGDNVWSIEYDATKSGRPRSRNAADITGDTVPSQRTVSDRIYASTGHANSVAAAASNWQAHAPTAARTTTQRYNPTTPGVLGQKVFCTHWMRTGECDFTQQGCMFLHRMPDLDTLEKLGFRAYPRWFREMPRCFQVDNANDFDEDGLNQQRVQMREMREMQQAFTPAQSAPQPPPPPPAPRDVNPFGDGRRADSKPQGFHQFSAPAPKTSTPALQSHPNAPSGRHHHQHDGQGGSRSSGAARRTATSGAKNRASAARRVSKESSSSSAPRVPGAGPDPHAKPPATAAAVPSAAGHHSLLSRESSPESPGDNRLDGYIALQPTPRPVSVTQQHDATATAARASSSGSSINAALPKALQQQSQQQQQPQKAPLSPPIVHKKLFQSGRTQISNTSSTSPLDRPAFIAPDRGVLEDEAVKARAAALDKKKRQQQQMLRAGSGSGPGSAAGSVARSHSSSKLAVDGLDVDMEEGELM